MSSPTGCPPSSGPIHPPVIRQLALLFCLGSLAAGCATNAAVRAGQLAESQQDYDRAVVEYTKVVRANPDDRNALASLEQVKLRAAQSHFTRARRMASTGKLEEALIEYQLALELNPSNATIEEELRTVRSQLRAKIAVTEEGKTQLETLIQRAMDAPMPGADLADDVVLPDTLTFREASSRDVFTAIGKWANVSIVFDPTFRDQPITIDLRKVHLADALDSVAGATRNFWKAGKQRTVTIVPDTPAKRREYEDEVVRTFYLSNADVKETIDILRIVVPPPTRSRSRTRPSGSRRQAASSARSARRGPKSSSTWSSWKSIARASRNTGCRSPHPI